MQKKRRILLLCLFHRQLCDHCNVSNLCCIQCVFQGAIEGCRNGFLQFSTSLMSCNDASFSVIPANILSKVLLIGSSCVCCFAACYNYNAVLLSDSLLTGKIPHLCFSPTSSLLHFIGNSLIPPLLPSPSTTYVLSSLHCFTWNSTIISSWPFFSYV